MADVVGVSRGYEQRRLAALDELTESAFCGRVRAGGSRRTMPPEALKARQSCRWPPVKPRRWMSWHSRSRAGYERCVQVEGTGQFPFAAASSMCFRRRRNTRTAWNCGTMRLTQSLHVRRRQSAPVGAVRVPALSADAEVHSGTGEGRCGRTGKGCSGALDPPEEAACQFAD